VQVRVAIPPGATARLHLPARGAADVTERGVAATRADGVTAVRREAGEVVVEMGSGDYEFEAPIVSPVAR
jgi:alpha-L-rhamnosidase